MLRAIQIVKVARESQTRIFMSTPKTFFSELDEWLYIEISDERLCEDCHANAQMEGGVYRGNHLRAFFPHLEILDEDTIKVNEHPNCRCVLTRIAKAKELYEKIVEVE